MEITKELLVQAKQDIVKKYMFDEEKKEIDKKIMEEIDKILLEFTDKEEVIIDE